MTEWKDFVLKNTIKVSMNRKYLNCILNKHDAFGCECEPIDRVHHSE
jgi:hypothetical protein